MFYKNLLVLIRLSDVIIKVSNFLSVFPTVWLSLKNAVRGYLRLVARVHVKLLNLTAVAISTLQALHAVVLLRFRPYSALIQLSMLVPR